MTCGITPIGDTMETRMEGTCGMYGAVKLVQSTLLLVEATEKGGRGEREVEEEEGKKRKRRKRGREEEEERKEEEKKKKKRGGRGEGEEAEERERGEQKMCTVHLRSQRILHGTREQRQEMPDQDVCQQCPGGIEEERNLSTISSHTACGRSDSFVSTGKFLSLI